MDGVLKGFKFDDLSDLSSMLGETEFKQIKNVTVDNKEKELNKQHSLQSKFITLDNNENKELKISTIDDISTMD